MKSKKQLVTLVLLLVVSSIFSQSNQERESRRTTNKVEKANKTVENTNEQIDSTIVGIDRAIDGATETAKKIGGILFGDKKKKKAPKSFVIITIASVSYDDKNVNQLYNEISKAKATKNVVKMYSNGKMTIQMESKTSADAVWQKVSQNIRACFNIGEISEKAIVLTPKK